MSFTTWVRKSPKKPPVSAPQKKVETPGKIMGIFGSLYNHVTGYFGDILSYARLMALMLAGSDPP